ncbi:ABC transporter permease [Candidatus Bipolaricaulota bacterium]|nr:ABC transporter permease [Candidatus Bipolaricaulota bacterium]
MSESKSVENTESKSPMEKIGQNVYQKVKSSGVILPLILLIAALSIISPDFLTINNFKNILRQVSVNLIFSVGTAFVILTGGIDVSVGAMLAFSAVIMAGLMPTVGMFPAVLIGLAIGFSLGLFNGLAVAWLKLPAFIVTLAMMLAARAFAFIYTGGYPVSNIPMSFRFLGSGYIGPFPVPVIISLGVLLIGVLVLKYTTLGRFIYGIGGNRDAVKLSGVNVIKYEALAYGINGLLAALAGVIMTARLSSAVPSIAESAPFDAIAAVVIGGVSLSGGKGSLWGVFVGVLIFGVISNGLNLMSVPSFWQNAVRGIVIFGAILFDRLRARS